MPYLPSTAGGKSKKDKDSNNEDEIASAAMNTKKGGKKPNSRGKPKKENPNKDKIFDHCNKKGHIKTTCWKKYPEKKPKFAKKLQRQASKQAEVLSQQMQLMTAKEKLSLLQQVMESNMCILIMT